MMGERTLEHPDSARLAVFGQGAVDHDEMIEIETHLEVCRSCCELLCSLPDDQFVERLRAAQKSPDWTTAFQADATVAATAQMRSDTTALQVPSSFVISSLTPAPGPASTAATSALTGFKPPEVPLEQELPPELLNHSKYEIVRKLGAGGMGSVYLAQHRVMERPVALKVIRNDLLGKPGLVERFQREVKSAAHLPLHPNIVAAYDAEQAGNSHFLVMEFVDGVNLGDLVKSQGPLSVEAACDAVRQAAEGLEHAHQRGMVHRDIKPQNLMRTPEGRIKILDFGLARLASEVLPDLAAAAEENDRQHARTTASEGGTKLTLTHMVLGSADYIAPEQATDPRSADIRADIYSLGCTLYYLLAGHPPFPEGNLVQKLAAHAEGKRRPLLELRPDFPPDVSRILDRMMANDRNSRFRTPAEVAESLAPFSDANAVHAEAFDLVVRKVGDPCSVDAQALLGEMRDVQLLPQPTVKTPTKPLRAWVKSLALVALLLGTVWLFCVEPPGWPAATLLLIGYAGLFGLEVGGWPLGARAKTTLLVAIVLGAIALFRMGIHGLDFLAALLPLLIGYAVCLGMEATGCPQGARVKTAAFLVLIIGTAVLFCMVPSYPLERAPSLLYLLTGYTAFFGMQAVGWRVTALLSLLIGFVGFVRLETPGWPWAAQLSLLTGCLGALGVITQRQLAYALLSVLIGYAWFFGMQVAGWPVTALLSLLTGFAGPMGIIAFRQLDVLVPVTRMRVWLCFVMPTPLCAAAIAFAGVYVVHTKVHGEGILLTEMDTFALVRAQATGRLVDLEVQLGQQVVPGMIIGHIAQNDVLDAIRAAEASLADLKREDRELTQFEEKERESERADGLPEKKHMGDDDLLESGRKSHETEDESPKVESREHARLRMQLERRSKIRLAETKFALDREKLRRTSQIVSQTRGEVAQILAARGELIHEGSPIVALHSPRELDPDHPEPAAYHSIIFVSAGEGRKILVKDRVEVSPVTVKSEEHGFIHGMVVAVAELPATNLTREEAFGQPALADALLKRYPSERLLRVCVRFYEHPPRLESKNRFRWSSSSGSAQVLKTGTMCQAEIITESRRLITLIIPSSKKFVDAD